MAERAMIRLQVQTLVVGLTRARAALPLVTKLDPVLGARVTQQFGDRAIRAAADLQTHEQSGDAEKLALAIARAEELLEESLAYLAAASATRTGMDEGSTHLAETWLDRLSRRAKLPLVAVVMPAFEESTRITSTVVRLRLPSHGVWGIPVAVHEFGHFVVARLTEVQTEGGLAQTDLAVEKLVRAASDAAELPQLYLHGHELFADAFAAAVAGPAYSRYCLRYRFPPETAHQPKATHPSSARRMRLQLRILEDLGRRDRTGFLAGEANTVRREWFTRLGEVGLAPEVPTDERLDALEDELVSVVLDNEIIKLIQYQEHTVAWDLAVRGLVPKGRLTTAQVVNAAWNCRERVEREEPDAWAVPAQVDELSARAMGLLLSGEIDG
jgi:hypothetical protein